MYQWLLKPIFFLFDPEKIHYFVFDLLKFSFKIPGLPAIIKYLYQTDSQILSKDVFGLRFQNPVGLAAGFDKNAQLIDELAAFGFGFIEIGTVTPKPQPGNDKPRLFRLPKDNGLINRMGFNNDGLDRVIENLKKRKSKVIIGGNIGKNKNTPNEKAIDDYHICLHKLHDYVDYFVVNVSSPNTPNLRDLQEKEPLTALLVHLETENKKYQKPKPILLKIAPDLTDSQLDDVVDIVKSSGIAGIIATNTTISRQGLNTTTTEIEAIGAGGLSGFPVKKRSTEVIEYINKRSGGTIPIIGVGGIETGHDAKQKLNAGASLVQVYTGFIYVGPSIVKKILKVFLK